MDTNSDPFLNNGSGFGLAFDLKLVLLVLDSISIGGSRSSLGNNCPTRGPKSSSKVRFNFFSFFIIKLLTLHLDPSRLNIKTSNKS